MVISRLVRLLSSKEKYNPNFYNWNKVFVRYCDGSSFISDRTYEKNGTKIYMYGKNNLLGVLNYLKNIIIISLMLALLYYPGFLLEVFQL